MDPHASRYRIAQRFPIQPGDCHHPISIHPLALALAVASTLIACNTVPTMPMGTAAKTPEERHKMAEHMKTMQDSMQKMKGMGGAGMGDMKGMPGMTAEMTARDQMMEKRMQMMETMMPMMMDRMPAPTPR